MSTENEVTQLIAEVFRYRKIPDGTCFYTNEPGIRLVAGDASYLSPIKAALMEAVQNRRMNKALKYVIGAFLVISTRYAPESIGSFIQSLPSWMQEKVIVNAPLFFRRVRAGDYNFGVGPASQLINFLEEKAKTEGAHQQEATAALRELSKPFKAQKSESTLGTGSANQGS